MEPLEIQVVAPSNQKRASIIKHFVLNDTELTSSAIILIAFILMQTLIHWHKILAQTLTIFLLSGNFQEGMLTYKKIKKQREA